MYSYKWTVNMDLLLLRCYKEQDRGTILLCYGIILVDLKKKEKRRKEEDNK